MRPTSRLWRTLGVGVVIAVVGVLGAQPILLIGIAGVGAYVLAVQYRAYRQFRHTHEALSVTVEPLRRTGVVDDEIAFTARVRLEQPLDSRVVVEVEPPLTARGGHPSDRRLVLEPGDSEDACTFEWTFPVAGRFSIPDASITITDGTESFTETLTRSVDQSITIDARRPRNVHVGQGGERVAGAFGEHPAGRGEGGILPEEIREYTIGDSLANIDWKATARFHKPHVREYETETDQETVLVIDHRGHMDQGPAGESMLDYAREVALGFVESAKDLDDPLGLYAVGDEGVTVERHPATSPQHYRRIKDALYDLKPTRGEVTTDGGTVAPSPSATRAGGQQLAREDSAFAAAVAPFLTDTESYVHRIEGDPLFETIRRLKSQLSGRLWTIIITTDGARNELRETTKLTTKGGDHASVLLTAQVLFESGGLTDLETAYDRYLDFEEYRRELDRIPRSTVFEVGPGDRLDALLAARRRRRT